jgi:hypothetical protein
MDRIGLFYPKYFGFRTAFQYIKLGAIGPVLMGGRHFANFISHSIISKLTASLPAKDCNRKHINKRDKNNLVFFIYRHYAKEPKIRFFERVRLSLKIKCFSVLCITLDKNNTHES